MAEELNLHTLQPAEGSHRERKRVGRGHGSGNGKTSGRGQKGQKSRAGSHRMRPGFEGGQMPLYMRLGKLRGPNHKKSMPLGPFRTFTTPVNVHELERFDAGAEVTPELLKQAGVVRSLKHPIKILATGELTKKLTVRAHGFSAKAVEVIEAAGGTVVRLGRNGAEQAEETKPAKPSKRKTTKAAAAQAEVQAPAAEEPEAVEAAEPEATEEPAAEAVDEPNGADGTAEEETE
ncbi:MAG: large subunit ribosomal protein [Gaiellales bacterium]|jgi:large subunit ribosomal protein L15|nr:large subunit ribosomal protein [Gaiellales bacterium]